MLAGEFGDLGRLFPAPDKPPPSGINLLRDLNAAGAKLVRQLGANPNQAVRAATSMRANMPSKLSTRTSL